MSLKAVCRLCLAMDVPMHNVVDSPLQSFYEKLTDIPLNTAHSPIVACYLCYSQLRKCHNLMVRSLKADKVLTQLLWSGEVINRESISMKKREIQGRNELIISPLQLIVIADAGHSPINANIKEEPLSPQCKEINTNRRRCIEYLTFERDPDSVIPREMESIENDGSMGREEICEQLEDAVLIKREKPDEMETYVQSCTGYLKFEHSEGEDGNERPLSYQRKELMEIDNKIMIPTDVENIEKEEFTDGQEIEDVELKEAVETGAAPAEKCKPAHAENTQDGSTLTPDGENILEKSKIHRTVVKAKATSNIGSTLSQSISNTIGCDNDCTSTNTAVDGTSSKHSRRMFVNDDCGNVFDDKYLLIERIVTVKKTRQPKSLQHFECDLCKHRCNRKDSLRVHMRVHTDDKPYECEICKVRFRQKRYLKTHLRIHTDEKPYECEICKVRFREKCTLQKHVKIHTGEKPYECEVCKVRFSRKSNLKTHSIIHTDEKLYKCEICEVRFSQKYYLKTHLRIHTGEKLYECEMCKVRFTHKSTLQNHLRVHTGERLYECEICKVRFTQKSTLQKHARIHTGEKLYECEICKVKFSQKSNLKIHSVIHTDAKPYECETCKVRFRRKGNLTTHLRIHTGEKPYECEICKIRFSYKCTLQKHLRIHTG